MASAADVSGAGEQPPIPGDPAHQITELAFFEIKLLLRARGRGTTKRPGQCRHTHFAQFVPLEDNQSVSSRL